MDGSGGLGAVSFGINETLAIPVLLLLAFGAWKLAKVIWAALAG
jgi:hypothetical protein